MDHNSPDGGCLGVLAVIAVVALIGYFLFGSAFHFLTIILAIMGIAAVAGILLIIGVIVFLKLNEKDTPATSAVEKANANNSIKLTTSVDKRRKIIEDFNTKHNLNLRDSEIKTILDASYMSKNWTAQIMDMDKNYDNISQWYTSDESGIKVYFYVFPVQNVSSDYDMQKKAVMDSFNDVFKDINPQKYSSVSECINAINNKYMTAFDDTSFMFVYRLLEKNGYKYELPSMTMAYKAQTDEMDDLKKKYDTQTM